jgi:8-oxo-dGTP pyrophosphatase MutT (NUDIX family)
MNRIRISSAVLLNDTNDLLVVRKKNSSFYMLPGGKIDDGESLIQTLIRELHEELDLRFSEDSFTFLGTHETNAVNESNTIVEGNIFLLDKPLGLNNISHHAEIEEVIWISKKDYNDYQLAHLLKEFALPKWLADFK